MKEQLEVRSKISCVEKDLEVSRKDLESLRIQLVDLRLKREEVELDIQNMRKQQNETKARYNSCVSTLSNARDLARKKDVKSLEELSFGEVNTCMSKWNTIQEFRCDYEKSILLSLDRHQLSSDGRIRNLDEEPINQQY
ncbi:hypothetical protein LWI28_012100 [Acer negundo]|uniref:Uncharacterized protein n=1 Tax=Acer negundo TaxID=4023 RepID=A0AAD5ITT3_ACENE|nr:hypothetical protein LWI28_012100 [Acer negundo]